jgi:TonB-linked SusC/RagA family outer membrane protein
MFLLMMICYQAVTAQNDLRKIRGTVVDETEEPVAGATVALAGTTTGAATDADGKFELSVPLKGSLQVSYIGYQTVNVPLTKETSYLIKLESGTTALDEVLVVGYGVQRKESVVGAVSQVKGDELVKTGQTNITTSLYGKVSGVTTIQRSGMPGSDDAEIIIRGLSSFNNSSPLVLVDGVERDFSSLDPNEVNTISVLKDASATAVFGAKGANGVIIVTTKRGTDSKPDMNFTFSYGVQNPINVAKHVDGYTTMSMLNRAHMNDRQFTALTSQRELEEYRKPSSPINAIRYPDTDWFTELTKPFAPAWNANFNIRGGNDFVRYFSTVGFSHQGSFFESFKSGKLDTEFYYNRVNYRINLDFNLTKSTLLAFNLGGNVGIQNQPVYTGMTGNMGEAALWSYVFGASTTKVPLYYPAWVMEAIPDTDYPGLAEDRLIYDIGDTNIYNPYFGLAGGRFRQFTDSQLFSDIMIEQKLDFITKGLTAKGKFSLSTYYKYNSLSTEYQNVSYSIDWAKYDDGTMNPWKREGATREVYTDNPIYTTVGGLSDGYYHDIYYDMSLNYDRTFGDHTATALLLLNRQEKDRGTEYPYYNEAVVARGTYDFAHRYLLELNMGYTGSERFAPDNRFGFFPSAAVGWVLSEENFFKKVIPQWFSKAKFRYSDGLVGSDYAANRWLYISNYTKDANGSIKEEPSANTVAQWERARKRDLGIELGFLNNDLTINLDFFDEYRDKILISVTNTVPMWVGNNYKELNKGEIKKHGMEVEAEYRKRIDRNRMFFVRGNFGFNENRIVYQDDAPYALSHQKKAGTAVGAQTSGIYLTGNGFYTSVDDIHSSVSALPDIGGLVVGDYKYLDYMGDGLINRDDLTRMKGSTQPPINYSFAAGFQWRNFDLSVLFHGYAGKYINFDQLYEYEFYKGNYNIHVSQLDYYAPWNPNGNHGALHYAPSYASNLIWSGSAEGQTAAGYSGKIFGKSWRNADFLRFKELHIGYSLQSKTLNRLTGIKNVKLYLTGNNLLTFTSLIEGDPENTYLLYGNYPQMRTIKAGLDISF